MDSLFGLKPRFDEAYERGLWREKHVLEGPQGGRVLVHGKTYLSFASNDYLSLASHPVILEAAHRALDNYGFGSGSASWVSGQTQPLEEMEHVLAEWLGFERTIHFSSGYLAHLGVIPVIVGPDTHVFSAYLNHASLIDGIRLARPKEVTLFDHKDPGALRSALVQSRSSKKWIISDGVFSMDGDVAPILEWVKLAHEFGAYILVDDAHGLGVLGEGGRGILSYFGITPAEWPGLYMATLGKAMGTSGAFVAGNDALLSGLEQWSRTKLFSTNSSPLVGATTVASVNCLRQNPDWPLKLQQLGEYLENQLNRLGYGQSKNPSAIHPIIIGDNRAVMQKAQQLWDQGIWIPPIRPPTVPEGTARLRLSLCRQHERSDIDAVIELMSHFL